MGKLRIALGLGAAVAALAAAPAPAGAVVLVNQIPSGNFSVPTVPSFDYPVDAGDSVAADDFTVPAGQTWTPSAVAAYGLASGGSNGTDTASVVIYRDGASATPGEVVYSATGLQTRPGLHARRVL